LYNSSFQYLRLNNNLAEKIIYNTLTKHFIPESFYDIFITCLLFQKYSNICAITLVTKMSFKYTIINITSMDTSYETLIKLL